MTIKEEELKAHENELAWLLEEIHLDIKSSVIIGLEECIGQLCNRRNGVKLVMSSSRRETVKGTVDRVGTNISDCDMLIKLPTANKGHSFPIRLVKMESDPTPKNDSGECRSPLSSPSPPPLTSPSSYSYPLIQLVDTVNFLNEALQISQQLTTSSKEEVSNVQTQMGLSQILGHAKNALSSLHEPKPSSIYPQRRTDQSKFIDLPAGVAVDFYLIDSNVITDIRTFENIDDPASPTNQNAALGTITNMLSIGKKKQPPTIVQHDGQSVIEHERVRIESQDPNLISVSSKLTALETLLESMVRKLQLCLSA